VHARLANSFAVRSRLKRDVGPLSEPAMIRFRGNVFELDRGELVVLRRGARETWGLYIKTKSTDASGAKAPQFNLHGMQLPEAGVASLAGKSFELPNGESEDQSESIALIYVWDWSAANNNLITFGEIEADKASVIWAGSCDDPEFYDSRASAGTFNIQCACAIRYEQ
jgi:hypothetical protein